MLRYILIGIGILAIIPVALLAWWLLSPLWNVEEVNEEFPQAARTVSPPAPALPAAEFPLATRAVIPQSVTMEQVEELMSSAAEIEQVVADAMPAMPAMAAAVNSEPRALLSGQFRNADAFHRGSGTATVYELGDGGRRVLRFEDFRVTNGPDLRVLLANAPAPDGRSELADAGYIELAALKGNVGSQNYDIPDGFDLAAAGSVVIYCDPFRVIFSTATLMTTTPG